jgi:polyferredoxin
MILVIVFADQAPKFDVAHPGAGKFATSDIRYFLPYIPTVIFIFLFVFFFGRRGFCHRGCWIYPLIAFSTKVGTMIRTPSLYISMKNIDKCSNCKLCSKNCSMSIDVHKHVQEKKVLPNNCIQCGNCVDKCTKGVLSFSFGIQKAPTA